jgi:hypothetical protein
VKKEELELIVILCVNLVLMCGLIPSLLLWRDEIREEKRKAAQTTPDA